MIPLRVPEPMWRDVAEGTEALLDEWLVTEGDEVATGQPIARVIVVKSSYEVTAPADGRIAKILVGAQDTFAKDAELALLEETGAAPSPAPPATAGPPTAAAASARVASATSGVRERVPFTGLRGAVARNMTNAWQTVPRVAAGVEVDLTTALALLAAAQERVGERPRVSVTHLVLRAVALTLREHPRLNARVAHDAVEVMDEIDLGLAVNLDDGVVVPVIRGADRKSLADLATESADLATAARDGTLPPAAAQGATFTVTNLGATGIDWFTPIVDAPQVAILGVGRMGDRPVVKDGALAVAPTVILTLVYDHRAIDGQPASLFLAAVRDRLERARDL